MTLRNVTRSLAVGIAMGAVLVAAPSVRAADERGAVQGVGAGYESEWFQNVSVTTGESAKVGLALTNRQGAMLPPAWPKRLPQDQVGKVSKDAKDLPDGDGKQ